jgi:hypothetical protein
MLARPYGRSMFNDEFMRRAPPGMDYTSATAMLYEHGVFAFA